MPPLTDGNGCAAEAPVGSSAVFLLVPGNVPVMETLKKRPDFLRAAQARRQGTGGFLLQARDRADGNPLIRVGYTASKKVGNAVLRGRSKRRLREIARMVIPQLGQQGWDYVLVAKPGETPTRVFALLVDDLRKALVSIHRGRV